MQHSGAVKQMINGGLTILVPILMDVAYSIMYDISSKISTAELCSMAIFLMMLTHFLRPKSPYSS